ncbi:hypothetical protein [Microbulbifer sp. YPW16]|uniref:hypothetical protein n=1 Tax=Microbulbifer sp. YPW16 TaxID=2904242 RepID=UPI001E454820|nr:hypothetical protein [Microbulbifer sp. YPW16]UHQ54149.1 hypothetical protein LVE68_11530 [Microbulbifer sp. YPW16]
MARLTEVAEVWRARLQDISWFIRMLNDSIGREANREDRCTGRFWDGRFKSQALLDEPALAACMAYVDLNPIPAKMAETPENSDHSSIHRNITAASDGRQPDELLPFAGNSRAPMPEDMPFRMQDHIELVHWGGRILREDECGAIASRLPAILERLQIDPHHRLYLNRNF